MSDPSVVLREALVVEYRPYVLRRLSDLGIEPPSSLDDALVTGEVWLEETLEQTLAAPFRRQQRGPLEVFQEAMRFPTEVLLAEGRALADRDEAAAAALPGDHFDLAPASSQSVGVAVWEAHLAWGVAKARAMARPVVGLLSDDLFDATRIESEVGARGFDLEVWRRPPDLTDRDRGPVVVLVDLTHDGSDDTIRHCAGAGIKVVGFGPHVDDLAMVRARSLGASEAMPRSRFFTTLGELLPTIV